MKNYLLLFLPLFLLIFAATLCAQKPAKEPLPTTAEEAQKSWPMERFGQIQDSLVLWDSLFFYYRQSDISRAIDYCQRGLALAEAQKNNVYVARFSGFLGISYKNTGNYDTALYYYDRAYLIDSARADTRAMSGHLGNKGFVYKLKGEYIKALVAYNRALELIGDADPKIKITILNNIGNLYADQNNYISALAYYQKAKLLAAAEKDEKAIAYALNNIGNVYFSQKNYDLALLNFDSSLQIKNKIGDKRGAANSLGNIARVHFERAALDSAKLYLIQAEEIYLQIKDQAGLAEVYFHFGDLYIAQGDENQGVAYYEKCLQTSSAIGAKPIKLPLFKQLSTYYANKKDYEKAYIYAQEHDKLRDSLQTIEHIKQLNNLRHEGENRDQQRAIDALQQANEIQELNAQQQKQVQYMLWGGLGLSFLLFLIAANFYRSKRNHSYVLEGKNKQISEALNYSEMLLREIHHRVKNNLQIISSLLNLQRNSPKENILQQSQERLHTMSLLHELLYQSKNIGAIDLDSYVRPLLEHLRQAYQNAEQIVPVVEIAPISFDIEQLTPCGLILNELITNVYKYAFPTAEQDISGQEIKIQEIKIQEIKIRGYFIDANHYSLSVSDNGQGLPANFDITRGRSLGLRLVQGLAKQMRAQLVIQNQNPTTFSLIIPVSSSKK
jgi:two-component sensor histidine kinase